MAAAAWLLGASMGGPAVYFGEITDKPQLGPDGEWTDERLKQLWRLLALSGLTAAAVMSLYVWALA
jgi:adenosylcobinamide-phosphate synthase